MNATFAGKFKIISKLGDGGMGTVYLVQHLLLNREFAMKVLHGDQSSGDSLIRRFQQEAKTAFSLNHPNLIRVHEFGLSDAGEPYLLMDRIDGVTLAHQLKSGGRMPVVPACQIVAQVADGIAHAHRVGVVHRDIKPGNIMLATGVNSLEQPGSVKLLDFGIAKIMAGDGQALTKTGEVLGSPFYMSPEQCSGEIVSAQSDIYSLGCVFFEILTGAPPHMGPTPLRTMMLHQTANAPTLKEATLGAEFPETLEHIVKKMLSRSLSQRYDTADEVHSDLVRALSSKFAVHSNQFKTPSADEKAKGSPKLPGKLLMVGGVLLLVVSTAAITHLLDGNATTQRAASTPTQAPLDDFALLAAGKAGKSNVNRASKSTDSQVQMNQNSDNLHGLPGEQVDLNPPLVHQGSEEGRHFIFPERPIGYIYEATKTGNHIERKSAKAASGSFFMPGLTLAYEVNLQDGAYTHYVFEHRDLFSKFGSELFDGLDVTMLNESLKTFDKVILGGESNANEKDDLKTQKIEQQQVLNSLLQAAVSWRNLHGIRIDGAVIDDSCLKSLDKFSNISRMRLTGCSFNADRFAKLPLLKDLAQLELIQSSSAELLKSVSGSKKLRAVVLRDPPDLKPADLAALENCTELKFLTLSSPISDGVITAICKLPHLEYVHIESPGVTPAQTQRLLRIKTLNELGLLHATINELQSHQIQDSRIKVLKN